MAQGEILSRCTSPLCCDEEAGRVHRPVNDCYCSEWDNYYYLKASVLTSCLSLLRFTDLYIRGTGSITGPRGRLDFNLRMVINLKTISVLLKGITMLLLSSYISTLFLLFHLFSLCTTPLCITWLNFPEEQQMLHLSGILRPLKSQRLRLIDFCKL